MGSEQDRRIGENAARVRVEKGMSQQAVAEGMRARNPEHKWSQATVWGVEKGDRALKASEIHDLSKVLGTGMLVFVMPDRVGPTIVDLNTRAAAVSQAIRKAIVDIEEISTAVLLLREQLRYVEGQQGSYTEEDWKRINAHVLHNENVATVAETIKSMVGPALTDAAQAINGRANG